MGYMLDQDRVKTNCHAQYLHNRSFRSKFIVWSLNTQASRLIALYNHKVVAYKNNDNNNYKNYI